MSKPFDLKFIPFSQLHISELNMRHSETAPEIDDILPSVKERGIRQPLICLLYTTPSPRDQRGSRMPSSA